MKALLALGAVVTGLVGCGGGGGNSGTPVFGGDGPGTGGGTSATPTLSVSLSTSTVTGATPATVSAQVLDGSASKNPVPGVVVQFSTANGLGSLSAPSALTDTNGVASVTLAPSASASSGADNVVASAQIGTTQLSAQAGFQLTATSVAFDSFTSDVGNSPANALSAYGQAVLSLSMTGVSETSPVTLSFTSTCAGEGKASISPSSLTSTTGTISLTYKDTGGCGASHATDTITATIGGSGKTQQLVMNLNSPAANSISFVSASPQTIYLKGSGYQESSQVVFKVVDSNNNPLPNQQVTMNLTTFAGGLMLNSVQTAVTQTTDGNGQVTAIVNSGTVPTPVRVTAALTNGISTVSNSLAVAVGLPSELNFSLAQTTKNIEGMNVDGTTNTYTVRAADRSGNPVPDGTSITFWSEIGGQISATAQTSVTNGIATASASFVSSGTRPADGRVTVVSYALGEESFVDLNGNNKFDLGEPFQDLGDIVLDRLFDGLYDAGATPNGGDQYISLSGSAAGSATCTNFSSTYPQFALSANIPSRPATCSASWSSQTYVRRAVETVLSTSSARLLWASTAGLDASCAKITLQDGPYIESSFGHFSTYTLATGGDTWYGGSRGVLSFIVADANTYPAGYPGNDVPVVGRLNPMAAGTTISASGTTGLSVTVAGGSPVANSSEATTAGVSYEFDAGVTSGTVTVSVKSPGGLTTTYSVDVIAGARPSSCP
ncbi:hypothetical protein [Ideonella sp. BN130291]|uniref:hypothetical protein n=1 Tax=Ideonella sp. BN130291 TaxID=3112940 RepID=UPI002E265D5A|nr:hypothetical protein [Ideonella sp. BN130291]